MRWIAVVLALAAGCKKEPRPDHPVRVFPPPDAGPDCVTQCVQRNQMKAVSPEQIEADCRRDCLPH